MMIIRLLFIDIYKEVIEIIFYNSYYNNEK